MIHWTDRSKRLADLEARVDVVEREHKALELEWEEMYDKFRRLLARISKRQEDLETREKGGRTDDQTDPRQLSLGEEDRIEQLNRQIRENRRVNAVR